MYRKFNKKQWTDIFCPPDPHLNPIYIGDCTELNLFFSKAKLCYYDLFMPVLMMVGKG